MSLPPKMASTRFQRLLQELENEHVAQLTLLRQQPGALHTFSGCWEAHDASVALPNSGDAAKKTMPEVAQEAQTSGYLEQVPSMPLVKDSPNLNNCTPVVPMNAPISPYEIHEHLAMPNQTEDIATERSTVQFASTLGQTSNTSLETDEFVKASRCNASARSTVTSLPSPRAQRSAGTSVEAAASKVFIQDRAKSALLARTSEKRSRTQPKVLAFAADQSMELPSQRMTAVTESDEAEEKDLDAQLISTSSKASAGSPQSGQSMFDKSKRKGEPSQAALKFTAEGPSTCRKIPHLLKATKAGKTKQYTKNLNEDEMTAAHGVGSKISRCMHLPVRPGSTIVLAWNACGLLMILWDIIWMPMQVFDPPESDFTIVMKWLTAIFWTADILLCFFTGFTRRGDTIMNLQEIARHYFLTWFLPDVFIITMDWMLISDTRSENESSVGSSFRALRTLRVMRLARVVKCKRALQEIESHINSEYTSIIANLVKLILMLMMAAHVLACLWYFIGTKCEENDMVNWVSARGYTDASLQYAYTSAMHWSLTQFTPASMEIVPVNATERGFAIVVIICALVCFSSFISSITNSITQLRSLRADSHRQFWMLRNFLHDSNVPKPLSQRIMRYLQHQTTNSKAHIAESQVKVLGLLSKQLLCELRAATNSPHVICHPLFCHIDQVSDVTMQRLSTHAMSRISLAGGDPLFFQAESAIMMFFLIHGELWYVLDNETETTVDQGWICEPALWVEWEHAGDALSLGDSEVMSVDAQQFGSAVKANPGICAHVQFYATVYAKMLDSYPMTDLKFWSPELEKALADLQDPRKNEKISKSEGVVDLMVGMLNRISRMSRISRRPEPVVRMSA